MPDDLRLIEDYIPIEAISKEARREKSIRKGHISTLHLWWARRPLVASRAAVYGALVPAPGDKDAAKEAADFVTKLCKYPGNPELIAQAEEHILEAHANRLTDEGGELITVEDIKAGRAPRPKVLDMFAGGGAIPLEALRLGCQAYALDLNPVAHIIELCTLVYPQKYGVPDPSAKGCSEDGTWAGLAAEVEHWGKWVLEKVKAEIGDLYPPIPDPKVEKEKSQPKQMNMNLAIREDAAQYQEGMLTPVAYLWTRTVTCKNPSCGATVPLARQTWLAKKKATKTSPGRFIALKTITADKNTEKTQKKVRYQVVEANTEDGLGFDPKTGSKGGNAPCPFCGTVNDSAYVKAEGQAGRIGVQPMAVVCARPKERGKVYLGVDDVPADIWPDEDAIWTRIRKLEVESQDDPDGPLTAPDEMILGKLADQVPNYGMSSFGKLFSPRQLLFILSVTKQARIAYQNIQGKNYSTHRANAIITYIAFAIDKMALRANTFCTWATTSSGGRHTQAFGRQALEMTWDFSEPNPFSNASGSFWLAIEDTAVHATILSNIENYGEAKRASATDLQYPNHSFDAIITDPPYYDNIIYADLSDFFYVWLKRLLSPVYPEHFSSNLTPKKKEIVASPWRNESRDAAKSFYEDLFSESLQNAFFALKPDAPLVIVYAHKTTVGWSTLVDALRIAGFEVTEAWPIHTELTGHRKADTASLASSIFLVARKRDSAATGSYENEVRLELQRIVRERVERLWAQGITGADLVIACVGAGLRAFTRFAQVEYANGQPVPAETYLAEVEGVVLESLLEKLFGVSGGGVGRVDPVTRFYILWRFAYRHAALDAGEAIVFAYPQRVELDGPGGLTSGANPLVKKEKGKYTLLDFTRRGAKDELGLPDENGKPSSLVDVLHRLLYLVENQPASIPAYLDQARADLEHLRLVAQTLAGQTLSGNGNGGGHSLVAAKGAEAAALRKLRTNWRTLIESSRGGMI